MRPCGPTRPASPRWCSTMTSRADIVAPHNLMSDSTARESHCATSNGPRSPAASTAKRWPSTTTRAHRNRVDAEPCPRKVEERQRRARARRRHARLPRSSSTRALGHERRARDGIEDLAVLGAAASTSTLDDRAVHLRRATPTSSYTSSKASRPRRSHGRRMTQACGRSGAARGRCAARVATVRGPASGGPQPHDDDQGHELGRGLVVVGRQLGFRSGVGATTPTWSGSSDERAVASG